MKIGNLNPHLIRLHSHPFHHWYKSELIYLLPMINRICLTWPHNTTKMDMSKLHNIQKFKHHFELNMSFWRKLYGIRNKVFRKHWFWMGSTGASKDKYDYHRFTLFDSPRLTQQLFGVLCVIYQRNRSSKSIYFRYKVQHRIKINKIKANVMVMIRDPAEAFKIAGTRVRKKL